MTTTDAQSSMHWREHSTEAERAKLADLDARLAMFDHLMRPLFAERARLRNAAITRRWRAQGRDQADAA